MKPSDENLEDWLKSATEVPWSRELEQRILKMAQTMSHEEKTGSVEDTSTSIVEAFPDSTGSGHAPQRVVRRRRGRSWLVALGGVAAAVLVTVAVWNTGTSQKALQHSALQQNTSTTASQPPTSPSASSRQSSSGAGTANSVAQSSTVTAIGLETAPLAVENLSTASSTPGGPQDEVTATLVNTGTTPVSRADLFGVLSFHPGGQGTSGILQSVDWITFVDFPNETIMPGQSVSWSFKPLTAPTDGAGNLSDSPTLAFYFAGTVPGNMATDTWNVVPMAVQVSHVNVKQTWATGESFNVQTQVKNTTKNPLPFAKMLAIVWFDSQSGPNTSNAVDSWQPSGARTGSAGGFTIPGTARYFSTVSGPAGQGSVLQPGQSANLTFQLVGPVSPNLLSEQAHVLFISQGGKH